MDFRAEANGTRYEMGADLGTQSGEIDFIITIPYQPKTINIQLVKNGVIIAQEQTKGRDISMQFRHKIGATSPEWFRLDVRDKDGDVLAITNPFFVGPSKKADHYRYNDFKP